MPIIKSAKKALQRSIENKTYNDLTRSKIKNAVKGFKVALRNKEENVQELLGLAYRELDIAAKKNVIHKNKASRLKSRLYKAIERNASVVVVKKAKKKVVKTAKKK
jgi:small subunit ribosomal protein S20